MKNASDLTSPTIEAAKAALDAAGYHRGTPRDQIRDDHWPLIETLEAAIDKALDAEDEQRRTESQRRRQHAAQIALKKLRYKLDTCEPQHQADIAGQIAAILKAHPTLA